MPFTKSITLITLLVLANAAHLNAQADDNSISVNMPNAIKFMMKKDWQKAKTIFDKIIKIYAPNSKKTFGNRFGIVFYNKGYTELMLADKKHPKKSKKLYQEAKESFKRCREYNDPKLGGVNLQYTKALLYLAEAQQSLDEYQTAISTYKKFQIEREKKANPNKYNITRYHLNIAICYFKLNKPSLPEGIKHLNEALKIKGKAQVTPSIIEPALKSFKDAAIKNKQPIAFSQFIKKYPQLNKKSTQETQKNKQ